MSGRWRETPPDQLAGWLAATTVPWGIAGGWALDLWQGTVSRPHSDIEISCFLGDLPALLRLLPWPIIAPEIQLLYKCKQPRDKDLLDLARYVPALDEPARLWLRSAVATAHPEFLPTLLDIEALAARNDGIAQ